jgi:hypothetical protein
VRVAPYSLAIMFYEDDTTNIMQTWKIIGTGLLISVLVRGCPDTAKQSTNVPDAQPIQAPNTQRDSGSLPKPDSSLLKLPIVSPASPRLSKGIQDSFSNPIARNRPPDSEKTQLTSSQISVIPSVGKEVSSRLVRQEPETNSDVSHVQSNFSVGGEGRQSLINQESDQPARVNALNLPSTETEQRPVLENILKPISENSLTPALENNTTTSTTEENVAPQNQPFSSPVASSSSERGSGRCDYPWEFDLAGNLCGDRAASKRPNLSAGSAVGSYSAPIRAYSIPPSSSGSTYVRGYFRRDGTYVRGHSRRRR